LSEALQHKWAGLSKRQTKEVNPAVFFSILGTSSRLLLRHNDLTWAALWQYEFSHHGLPLDTDSAAEIQSIATSLISTADVNKQVLRDVPTDLIEWGPSRITKIAPLTTDSRTFPRRSLSNGAQHEFNPVCAIVGGVLGQDILKALGGRDPPIANFFVFDGNTGGGTVCRLKMA
jgi:ubiquitin-like 1-activating enzyme E1 A